ncbi:uncharacterized protein At5g39865-like [Telopea speciosissima]|uniref:uncharacterized protein At5g39865-like n=1 Tax=Telopea speciosissima TaxID=54955 RepID=UPI001CC4280D|nr:uncharacterized protein At5g39865-like [Telopea speciosissima]
MKGLKGRFLKKLKSIRPVTSLKPERILQVNASDGFLDSFFPHCNNRVPQNPPICKEQDDKINQTNLSKLEPEIINISELMKDLEEDEEMDSQLGEDDVGDKENIGLSVKPIHTFSMKQSRNPEATIILPEPASCHLRNGPLSELDVSSLRRPDPPPVDHNSQIQESSSQSAIRPGPLSEIDISSFRRPELNSESHFDPNLLTAFEQGAMDHIRAHEAERKARVIAVMDTKERKAEPESPSKSCRMEEKLLLEFEEKCPPGGSDAVILYTTSLRGIRKTFEDCNSIRFLLGSFRVLFYERDVSMHLEFREELWKILGGRVVPPRLFIKGRYIGGTEEVVGLHEQGKLRQLLQGFPADQTDSQCDGCAGIRFVLCFNCSGSRKIIPEVGEEEEEEEGLPIRCPECNENGLIICPVCC